MPEIIEDALRLALAITFVWSGSAKLGSENRLADAVAGILRISPHLAVLAARLFSVAEVTTAILLVFSPTASAGMLAAMGLGIAIFGLSAYAAATDRVYACGCFGSKSVRPIGWRNAAYGALILAAAAAPSMGDGARQPDALDSLALACAVTSIVLIGVLLSNARDLRRPIANFTSRRG